MADRAWLREFPERQKCSPGSMLGPVAGLASAGGHDHPWAIVTGHMREHIAEILRRSEALEEPAGG